MPLVCDSRSLMPVDAQPMQSLQPMRVAHVNKFMFMRGGQEAVMFDEARLLEAAGHTVALWGMHHPDNYANLPYAPYFAPYREFSDPRNPIGWQTKAALAKDFIWNQSAADQFSAFLDEFQPDLIHLHGIAHHLTPAVLAVAHRRGIPMVQTLHDYQLICPAYMLIRGDGQLCDPIACAGGQFHHAIQHRCVKGSLPASVLNAAEMALNARQYNRYISGFIAPSHFMRQQIIQAGIPAEKVHYLSNTVLPALMPEATTPSTVGEAKIPPDNIPPEKGYFLYFGRLSREKGLLTLLAAFRELPELSLVIVGSGPQSAELTAYANVHAMRHVQFTGYIHRDQMRPWLQGASAVILPSEWYENAPMSVIEAFLQNKPVIASRMGGLPEMVQPGVTGLLFDRADASGLRQAVRQLVNDPDTAARMGRQANDWAQGYCDPLQHQVKLEALYHRYHNV
jgi:glycosyltransferase involved in cell wall biosynthesis